MADDLTNRERRFVDAYLVHLDPQKAAIEAGYSLTVAKSKAYQWVSNSKSKPDVFAAVELAEKERSAKTGITIEILKEEMRKIGFSNMQDYMNVDGNGYPHLDFSKLTREQAAALGEVTVEEYVEGKGEDARPVKKVKFKLLDKLSALEKLGKHLGMFKEESKVQVNVANFYDIEMAQGLGRLTEKRAEAKVLDNPG